MNYIKHLTAFFDRIIPDHDLNPTHISLYIALFQSWNVNRFKNPISITRDEMMRISKICSKATYHKCMRELNAKQYIKYEPSFNPYKGSMVILFDFSEDLKPVQKKDSNPKKILPVDEQVLNKHQTTTETTTEQALVPSINYINNTNILKNENVENLNEQAKKFEEINNFSNKIVIPVYAERSRSKVEGTQKEEKSSAKKEEKEMQEKIVNEKAKSYSPAFADYNAEHTETSQQKKLRKKKKEFFATSSAVEKPTIQEVKSYFQEQNYPELEAQKFFNYFSSNGWLVGGKTPMVDWQAAAQNWMLNSTNFSNTSNTPPPIHHQYLNATTDKNYAEPL